MRWKNMIKIIIPTFIKEKDILNDEILSDICQKSFNENTYNIEFEERQNGRYIQLVKDEEVHIVCLSASEQEYQGRNSFLSQFLGTAFTRYKMLEQENKRMEVYLLMTSDQAFIPYQKFIYRCCRTLKINLLNIAESILPFSTYKDIKNTRAEISDRNTGNNSSYFSDTGEFVEFFAKCYGANGKESVFLAMVVKELTDKPIVIYQVEDRGQRKLSDPDRAMLESNGFTFGEEIISDDFNRINLDENEKELRNQPAFRLNLFQKFGDKKCYLCECNIDSMIIASHIHRVTDIKKDTTISEEDKKQQIIDGNNGLWLCANHDKLFEYGLIYFDRRRLMISKKLNSDQQNFVKLITFSRSYDTTSDYIICEESNSLETGMNFEISEEDYSEKMEFYLEKHKNRVMN